MNENSITQKTGALTATFSLESEGIVRIVEEEGKTKSSTSFRLAEISEHSDRIGCHASLLTKNSAILLTVTLCMLGFGASAFFSSTKPATTDESAIAFILAVAGAVSTCMVLKDIFTARRLRGDRFVFFSAQTGRLLFSFYVNKPSESKSHRFKELLESEIQKIRSDREEFQENDFVISEVENLASLLKGGILSNDEFEKAKRVLLRN